jgi:hypothetical protein
MSVGRSSATITFVRRFALAIIVSLLTFSASGVSTLFVDEPCTGYEQPGGRERGTCPPTCVTCGCCEHAIEPAVVAVMSSMEIPVAEINAVVPRALKTHPRDILHVPKAHLS